MSDAPAATAPAPARQATPYDPKNYIAVMVHICDTFGLNHEQMMKLRRIVERAFQDQSVPVRKSAPAPVTLNGVAITYGLMISFGGYEQAVRISGSRVVKVAREYDPYKDADPLLQKAMHKQAIANRQGRR